MELTLVAASWRQKINGASVVHAQGAVIDVSDEVGEWLVKNGAATIPADAADEPAEGSKPAVGTPEDTDDSEAEDAQDTAEMERPIGAAKREIWEAYARSKKIDPSKFKSKEELIAAIPE